ncbi:MFS transporter [Anaerocolumna sp. MB42-C2]|uniref:MFS transporter n=1 Tax=Anaerocolumna sp. MB42-C2 TaxID=3070997 RepID=UPI0027DEE063|nr:MFS transporter [Anaerocolumna sp. MB42-C2]WMJ90115.1 MFS transporter [Anaerocolumna sp. MB42-C2]
MSNKKVALSVFMIAFAFGLNITGIMPVLGVLNENYQSQGTSAVQLLQTIPYVLLIIGSLLIGWLTTRLSKKTIAAIGLFIIGLCGVMPFFIKDYSFMFTTRLLIGFGFGIVSPINAAIIAEFFKAEERAAYIGIHVVGMGFGSMVSNLLGGILAGLGYRYYFLVYVIAFVSMAGIIILLPHTPPVSEAKEKTMKLNGKVYIISVLSFLHTLFITSYSTNIGIYVLEKISSNTAVTGVVTAINAAFALIIGAVFAKISKIFHKFTLPFAVLLAASGYASILFIPGLTGVYFGSALCGMSLSCFMAQATYIISIIVDEKAVAKASGIFAVIGGIGGLISPIIIKYLSEGFLKKNSAANQFIISLIGMAVLCVITFVFSQKQSNRPKEMK